jgi:hypothetical protein
MTDKRIIGKKSVLKRNIILVSVPLIAAILVPFIYQFVSGLRDEMRVKNEMTAVESVVGSDGFIKKISNGSGSYLASRDILEFSREYKPALAVNYYAMPDLDINQYFAIYNRLEEFLKKRSDGHISRRPNFQLDLIREQWNKQSPDLPGAADFGDCRHYMIKKSAYNLCIEHFPRMNSEVPLMPYQWVSDMIIIKPPYNLRVYIETIQKDDTRYQDLLMNTNLQ